MLGKCVPTFASGNGSRDGLPDTKPRAGYVYVRRPSVLERGVSKSFALGNLDRIRRTHMTLGPCDQGSPFRLTGEWWTLRHTRFREGSAPDRYARGVLTVEEVPVRLVRP
jgi:hypothetical protein